MSLTNHSDGRSDEDVKRPEKHPGDARVGVSQQDSDEDVEVPPEIAPMGTKKALIAWLILCYSVSA